MALHHKTEYQVDNGSWIEAVADEEAGPGKSLTIPGLAAGSYQVRLRITPLSGGAVVISDAFTLVTAPSETIIQNQASQTESSVGVIPYVGVMVQDQTKQTQFPWALLQYLATGTQSQAVQAEAGTGGGIFTATMTQAQATQAEEISSSTDVPAITSTGTQDQLTQSESISGTAAAGGVTLVGAGAAARATAIGTLTLPLPSGVQSGDLLIIHCAGGTSPGYVSGMNSSGWTTGQASQWFYKIAGSSESDPVVNIAGGAGGSAIVFAFRGANSTLSNTSRRVKASSSPISGTANSTLYNNSLVFVVYDSGSQASGPGTVGGTFGVTAIGNDTTLSAPYYYWYSKTQATAGQIGTSSSGFTWTTTATGDEVSVYEVAIQ